MDKIALVLHQQDSDKRSLKTKKTRDKRGRGAAVQFCPRLSLREMKDARDTCVRVFELSSPPSVLCTK